VRRLRIRATQQQVENGGGGMPAFRGQLTRAQIHAVAEFVAQNASH
jgi:mono/diheme cytochrome c family protein